MNNHKNASYQGHRTPSEDPHIEIFLFVLCFNILIYLQAAGFHAHDSSSAHDRSYLWKFLVAVAGVYCFFLFETISHLFLKTNLGHQHAVEVRM